MDQIKDLIPQVISDLLKSKPGLQLRIEKAWKQTTKGETAKHTSTVGLKKRKLLVNVDSPVWLFQLNIRKKKILEKIKNDIPELTDITFRIGKVE